MGSQVIAKCKCGNNSTISVGGGKLNFKRINYFPCLCLNCNEIVQVNLKDENLRCPKCNKPHTSPYNSQKLIGSKGITYIYRNFENILTDGTYFCPLCNCMTLHFERGDIFWD